MNTVKRRTSFIVIGIILIVIGAIIFIISSVQLYNIQTTKTHWIEGFMQDYQTRTNATNSIPCYIFMSLSIVMVIAGIIMLCIKPRQNLDLLPNRHNSTYRFCENEEINSYCPKCKSQIDLSDNFCKYCGYNMSNEFACSACGQINTFDSKFCVKCGKKF